MIQHQLLQRNKVGRKPKNTAAKNTPEACSSTTSTFATKRKLQKSLEVKAMRPVVI
jgi:hypothetical protein